MDQATGHLYVFATRTSDLTGGVQTSWHSDIIRR